MLVIDSLLVTDSVKFNCTDGVLVLAVAILLSIALSNVDSNPTWENTV